MNKRGLGRGLESLFNLPIAEKKSKVLPENKNISPSENGITEIPIAKISPSPFQPRRIFEPKALQELANSIKENGIIQPIVLRKTKKGYEIAAGERRFRAASLAGLKKIPAIIQDYTDEKMMEIALVENLQRENLNPIEEALAFQRLVSEFKLTQDAVSKKIGRSRSVIANSIRLLNLHEKVQELISDKKLNVGQTRPLLAIEDKNLQYQLALEILEKDYSARDVEELVRSILDPEKRISELEPEQEDTTSKKSLEDNFYLNEYEDRLTLILGSKVKIKQGKLKSKIEIEYYSDEDLERIVETLSLKPEKTNNMRQKNKPFTI